MDGDVKYYVIRCDENGDQRISEHTEDDLIKKLNENYWGYWLIGRNGELDKFHDNLDLQTFQGLIIIKGKIIVPKPKETVVTYTMKDING